MRQDFIDTINETRASHGVTPLHSDTTFRIAAQRHARDLSNRHYFSSDSKEGTTPIQRIQQLDRQFLGQVGQLVFQVPLRNNESLVNTLRDQLQPTIESGVLGFDTTTIVGIGLSKPESRDVANVVIMAGFRVVNRRAFRRTLRRHLFREVNRFRTSHSLGLLETDRVFRTAARRHARDMVQRHFFSHVTPGGANAMDRIDAVQPDYAKRVLENLAYQTPAGAEQLARDVVDGWAHSPGHRKNMLTEGVVASGFGIAFNESRNLVFVVHKFGNRFEK